MLRRAADERKQQERDDDDSATEAHWLAKANQRQVVQQVLNLMKGGRASDHSAPASMPRSFTFLLSVLRLMPRKSAALVLTPEHLPSARSIRACSTWSTTS